MITRTDIINELKRLKNLSPQEKDADISGYLDAKDVPEEERDKIVSDLVSYDEY